MQGEFIWKKLMRKDRKQQERRGRAEMESINAEKKRGTSTPGDKVKD